MEADKNPFPKMTVIDIGELAREVGQRLFRLACFFPDEAPAYMSDHNRGGGPALDRALYDDPNQLELDYGNHD